MSAKQGQIPGLKEIRKSLLSVNEEFSKCLLSVLMKQESQVSC
jgi:hypothetical protein